jgi:hypothetical protein
MLYSSGHVSREKWTCFHGEIVNEEVLRFYRPYCV